MNDIRIAIGNQATTEPTPTEEIGTCDELTARTNWLIGQRSEDVKRLQECLTSEGLYDWPYGATGYFGPYTRQILAKSKSQQAPENSCENLKGQIWVEGERSERVKQLQECMQDAGTFYWRFGATGYFGSVTKNALINWRGFF